MIFANQKMMHRTWLMLTIFHVLFGTTHGEEAICLYKDGGAIWKPAQWNLTSLYDFDRISPSATVICCDCSKHGECNPDKLKPGFHSTDSIQEVGCFCDIGWDGENCQNRIDWCVRYKPCLEGQECNSTIEHLKQGVNYTCGPCPGGYEEGEKKCLDIDECALGSDDCDQICTNTQGSYECQCVSGYILDGGNCTDINECELLIDNCEKAANCMNSIGTFECPCYSGYSKVGGTCSADQTPDCDICEEPGICIEEGTSNWVCHCRRGYEYNGGQCINIDECTSNSHSCDGNSECVDTDGSYNCTCNDGYTIEADLRTCKGCPEGTWGKECSRQCNCKASTTVCDPGMGCAECSTGFTGGECDEDIDECKDKTSCNVHSINCTNTYGSYRCHCKEGYTLTPPNDCRVIDLCTFPGEDHCLNGGVCKFDESSLIRSCDCKEALGWTGKRCETNVNECESDPCQNGGTCHDLINYFGCECPEDFGGDYCEKKVPFNGSPYKPPPPPEPTPDPSSITKAVIWFSFAADFDVIVRDETRFKNLCVEQLSSQLEVDKWRFDKVTAKKGSIAMKFDFLRDLEGKPVYSVVHELKYLVEEEALFIRDDNGIFIFVYPSTYNFILVKEGSKSTVIEYPILSGSWPELYPYGSVTDDNVYYGSDDSTVRYSDECVAQGIIYGCQKYKNIFINTNGFVSLGERFDGSRPQQLPLDKRVPLIAPLWIDIELGPSPGGDSVIYYNCYKNTEDVVTNNQTIQSIMEKAEDDLEKQEDSSFNLDFIVIITWHKVIPFPFDESSLEKNTFQLVLLQDIGFQRSKMMFLYGKLDWSSTQQRANSMGFQGPGADFGTSLSYSGSDVAFMLDQIKGNTGQVGVNSYNIANDTCIDKNSPEYKCNNWYARHRKAFQTEAELLDEVLPKCPCNRWKASYDPRFVEYDTDQDTVCFISHALYSDGERTYTGARQCCYNDERKSLWKENTLYYQSDFESGSILKNNPFHYPTNFLTEDMVPKKTCCIEADLCSLFYEIRHSTGCEDYAKPQLTWCWGDPHIKTMDGFRYDFNGLGEYWLIKSPNFNLQGRTARAKNSDGMLVDATVLTGFAAQATGTPTIEFFLTEVGDQELKVFQNGIEITDQLHSNPQNFRKNTHLSMQINGTSVEAKFSSAGIGIIVTPGHGILSIQLTLSDKMRNISWGLLGIFDDDQNNDLTTIDGDVLPLDTPESIIHNSFGEKWRILEAESLFSYHDGSYAENNVEDFKPHFVTDINEAIATFNGEKLAEMKTTCGEESHAQCIFDYVMTGSTDFAKSTLDQDTVYNRTEKELENTVPSVSVNGSLILELGDTGVLHVVANDPDGDPVELKGENIPLDIEFNPVDGIAVWQPSSLKQWPDVGFYGSDSLSDSPTVVLQLKLCDCSKHGECNPDKPKPGYRSTDSFQEVGCFCDSGWKGDNCLYRIDWCERYKPCLEGQMCTSTIDKSSESVNFKCGACPSGYEGGPQKCFDIDECQDSPCDQICVNIQGSYECSCKKGYTLVEGKCKGSNTLLTVTLAVVLGATLIVVLAVVIFCCCHKRKQRKNPSTTPGHELEEAYPRKPSDDKDYDYPQSGSSQPGKPQKALQERPQRTQQGYPQRTDNRHPQRTPQGHHQRPQQVHPQRTDQGHPQGQRLGHPQGYPPKTREIYP